MAHKKRLRKRFKDITQELPEEKEKVTKEKPKKEEQPKVFVKASPIEELAVKPLGQPEVPENLEDIAAPIIVPQRKKKEREFSYEIASPGEAYDGIEDAYEQAKKQEGIYENTATEEWMKHAEHSKKEKRPF